MAKSFAWPPSEITTKTWLTRSAKSSATNEIIVTGCAPVGPIRIEHFNEPQPDIVLYKRGVRKHPTPTDIYLVVEVSDTTLAYDSGDKLRAYEEGGIEEYWIVDLVRKAVHIHRLKEDRYNVITEMHGKISPQHFPDVVVGLNELF